MKESLIPKVRFPEFDGEWINEQLGKHIKKTDKRNKENLNLPVYSINNKEGFLPQSEQFDGVNSNDRGFDISIYKIIQPNTFAYNPARINVGSIGYSHNLANVLISSLYVCFQTDDKIDDSFLLAFLDTNHFKTSVLRFQEGGVRQYLFFDNLSKIKLPFPSLPEQQKIAHFFSITDKKLTQLQEKKRALELYKKGMMQQIFSQQLRFKDDNDNDFPEWEVKKLEEVGKIMGGGTPESSNTDYWSGEIPWVSSSDIFENDIHTISITRFISKNALKESATKLIPKNSILIVSRVGIGKFAISNQELCTSQDFSNFIPEKANSFFLAYLFSQNKDSFLRLAQGTSIKGFTGKDIRNLKFIIPSSKKEQTKIANFLSKIDDKINTVTKKIEQTKEYKKGVLQKMFV